MLLIKIQSLLGLKGPRKEQIYQKPFKNTNLNLIWLIQRLLFDTTGSIYSNNSPHTFVKYKTSENCFIDSSIWQNCYIKVWVILFTLLIIKNNFFKGFEVDVSRLGEVAKGIIHRAQHI